MHFLEYNSQVLRVGYNRLVIIIINRCVIRLSGFHHVVYL